MAISTRAVAVILAAGRGTRIGGPKALLTIEGETFVGRLARTLARTRVDSVLAVVAGDAPAVREAARAAGIEAVLNPRPEEGMLASLLLGLDAADARRADAVLVHPVDHPLVAPATVDRVLDALDEGARIAVPSHGGRRGHPAGFLRSVWDEVRAASPATGAVEVLRAHPGWVVHVEGDPGAVSGIDTPADYARLVPRP